MMRRIAVPYTVTLIVLDGTVGLLRIIESPNRTHSIAYKYAKLMMPIHWWGVAFLTVALLILLATYTDPIWVRAAACAGLFLWLFWSALLLMVAGRDGVTSFVGPLLYAAAAVRHFQVVRSG